MAGTLIIILSLLICTRSTPKSAQFVFTDFENHTGWANGGFVVLLGLLQSQFSMTGYDSAAHMVSVSSQFLFFNGEQCNKPGLLDRGDPKP
jgi:amino acid transporter